ncbi:MAG: T9SS type A sorting domain-containing protein [Bacteroidota bacterium]
MRRTMLTVMLTLLFQRMHSQTVFCPPGAVWNYTYFEMFTGSQNEQVKYVRDSVLGTDTVKVLRHFRYFKNMNIMQGYKYTLIKKTGDIVYFRNLSTQHAWQVLYNFGATAGQSWQNTISLFDNSPSTSTLTAMYSIMVDSVNYVNVNGFNLKRLYLKYWSQYANPFTGFDAAVITERFGNHYFLFNFYNYNWMSDGDQWPNILCYQDSTFGAKQFSNKPCNYVGYNGINDNVYNNAGVKIYPNPARDFLYINSENALIKEETNVRITDLLGRHVKDVVINFTGAELVKVDISELNNGLYLLSLVNNGKVVYTGKLLKQQ